MTTTDPKDVDKELRKEVKRQKSRLEFKRNSRKINDRVKQYYYANLHKERERKRVGSKQTYDSNPQKERDRKRVGSKQTYDSNPQKERDRGKRIYEARKESQGTAGDLQKFLDKGRYGPIFRDGSQSVNN